MKEKFILLLCLFAFSGPLLAGTTGKIVGTIKDQDSGEPLIGADVVLEGSGLGSSTDSDGYFSILNVPPGVYNISVHYIGYASITIENIRVFIDRTVTQNVTLSSKFVEGETVVVEADRSAIELDKTHSSSTVSAEAIDALPVVELEEVIGLQAGVVRRGGQLHFRGGRAREVAYIVDGVPVTNSFSGTGGSLVEVDNNMVEQLEVISGTFNAEYGQAQSGVVNIVTKRPASSFNFNVKAFSGEWASDKETIYLGISKFNPAADRQVEMSLTGPIISNKLGFVITGRFRQWESVDRFERRFNTIDGWRISAYQRWAQQQSIATGGQQGIIEIPDSLATGNLEQGPMGTGDYGSVQAKLVFSPQSNITLSYQGFGSMDKRDGPFFLSRFNVDGDGVKAFRYAPDDFGTTETIKHSHFLRFQHAATKTFFYNLAASYQREDGDFYYRKDNKLALFPGDDGVQLFSAFGGNTFSLGGTGGLYTGAPGKNYIDQYLVQGDFNWQVDKHNLIKGGVTVKRIIANVFVQGFRTTPEWDNFSFPLTTDIDPSTMSYAEYWNQLTDYWRNWEAINGARVGRPVQRVVAVEPTDVAFYRDFNVEPLEASAFLQDKIELGSIIINAGLRFDYFDPNSQVPINYRTESFNLGSEQNLQNTTKKTQFSPRLGISFPISSRGAFHASYGHFFQMPPYEEMFNEPLVSLTRFQLEGRTLGNADLLPEKTIAYEIGLQQGLTSDISIDVTAYYKDFRNLLGVEQLQTIDGVTFRRFVNRDYGSSKGITLDLSKRRGFVNGGINYTLSFANGSASDPTALFLINTATTIGGESETFAERKVLSLDWDQRHTVNAFLNFIKRDNWSIGLTGFFHSGNPFSPIFIERFDIAAREYRNAATTPTQWNVDIKGAKHFPIGRIRGSVFLRITNLFDQLNHERVFASTGRADQVARLPEVEEQVRTDLASEGLFTLQEVDTNPGFFSKPRLIQLGLEFKY